LTGVKPGAIVTDLPGIPRPEPGPPMIADDDPGSRPAPGVDVPDTDVADEMVDNPKPGRPCP